MDTQRRNGFSVASIVKSRARSKTNVIMKANQIHISESELNSFGVTAEEWKKMQYEDEKDEKIRKYLSGMVLRWSTSR
ncbi:hypothetical protein RclHR1_06030005 [Rhizophagus clarus]|uniref:Uncharacterized protein n=1 Tax=Rhizophagus clarus TaxID=94130 RepID=A0A2Z6S2M7_9GLOM|nr:hypothetical protein RclHR1_06030005 [Rhizophagus clarus]